jgi:isopropylmalate/homocitrate/citramalate synthase
MPDAVTICECFARDGLQHEPEFVPTATKVALLDSFADAGFRRIEATSYSHPSRVPGSGSRRPARTPARCAGLWPTSTPGTAPTS